MPELTIASSDLAPLNGKVVIITGCASGIGLAASTELLEIGAKVVGGDLSPSGPRLDKPDFEYVQVDVTNWKTLVGLFKAAVDRFGRVDHVFANAGIQGQMKLLKDEFDEDGDLKRPDHKTFDVNFTAVIDTTKLAIHHIKKNPNGGSVVATASCSSYQRFGLYDYAAAKHGVLGLVRGLWSEIGPGTEVPVRINGIAPSLTATGMFDEGLALKAGLKLQGPEIAARSALILMADQHRHGEIIYSQQGKYFEIESPMLKATEEVLQSAPSVHKRTQDEGADLQALRAAVPEYYGLNKVK